MILETAMKKRFFKIALTMLLTAAMAFTAAILAFPGDGIKRKTKENADIGVIELRGAFRKSSAVIEGICIESHISPSGSLVSSYSVEKMLAGKGFIKGDTVTVLGKDEKGSRRIIYLGNEINDVHSENESFYTLASGAVYAFDGENIIISEGMSVPIDLLESDIDSLKKETLIPNKYFYCGNADKLIKSCSAVFIGRIEGIDRDENAALFTNNRGEVIRQEGAYSELNVRVMNGLASPHSFGEKVKIRLVDGCEDFIIDEKTNEHFVSNKTAFEPIIGNVYVFFLKKSSDEKAEHYFLVNAYQGMIETFGDGVFAHPENAAFADIAGLKELMNIILKASGMPGAMNG